MGRALGGGDASPGRSRATASTSCSSSGTFCTLAIRRRCTSQPRSSSCRCSTGLRRRPAAPAGPQAGPWGGRSPRMCLRRRRDSRSRPEGASGPVHERVSGPLPEVREAERCDQLWVRCSEDWVFGEGEAGGEAHVVVSDEVHLATRAAALADPSAEVACVAVYEVEEGALGVERRRRCERRRRGRRWWQRRRPWVGVVPRRARRRRRWRRRRRRTGWRRGRRGGRRGGWRVRRQRRRQRRRRARRGWRRAWRRGRWTGPAVEQRRRDGCVGGRLPPKACVKHGLARALPHALLAREEPSVREEGELDARRGLELEPADGVAVHQLDRVDPADAALAAAARQVGVERELRREVAGRARSRRGTERRVERRAPLGLEDVGGAVVELAGGGSAHEGAAAPQKGARRQVGAQGVAVANEAVVQVDLWQEVAVVGLDAHRVDAVLVVVAALLLRDVGAGSHAVETRPRPRKGDDVVIVVCAAGRGR